MRRPTLPRRLQRERTRRSLVEAALVAFAARGYEGATVDDIAAAAGFSKGAYYFHFSSKDEILLELVRAWRRERDLRLEAARKLRQPPAAALASALEALLSYEGREARWLAVLPELWSQVRRSGRVRRQLHWAYAGWRRVLTRSFGRARDAGFIAAEVDPATAAALALAAHDGLVAQARLGLPWAAAASSRELVAALLAPLAAEAPAPYAAAAPGA